MEGQLRRLEAVPVAERYEPADAAKGLVGCVSIVRSQEGTQRDVDGYTSCHAHLTAVNVKRWFNQDDFIAWIQETL